MAWMPRLGEVEGSIRVLARLGGPLEESEEAAREDSERCMGGVVVVLVDDFLERVRSRDLGTNRGRRDESGHGG